MAKDIGDAKRSVDAFLSREHYEGVIVKLPHAECLSGQKSVARGRIKRYTILDSLLVGYYERKESFLVALWDSEQREVALPFRTVEKVTAECRDEVLALVRDRRTRRQPQWLGPGKAASWYLAEPPVVAVKCDGLRVPNRGSDYPGVKWVPHEGTAIVGVYPTGKSANTRRRLYELKPAPAP